MKMDIEFNNRSEVHPIQQFEAAASPRSGDTLTTSNKARGPLAPARRVGLKPAICGLASAQGVYEPGSRRRLLASGRFKANQPVIMTGTGRYVP